MGKLRVFLIIYALSLYWRGVMWCCVVQEYGCDRDEKRYIGSKMCGALLEKIKYDMNVAINGKEKGRVGKGGERREGKGMGVEGVSECCITVC